MAPSLEGTVWILRICFFVMVFSDGPVRGGGNQRGRPIWFDPRTEGCSQAFGVLRPTMVLSAKVHSRIGAASSASFSNLLDLRPLVRVASTHGFHRGHWINHFSLPSAGCCMTSCHHEFVSANQRSMRRILQDGKFKARWAVLCRSAWMHFSTRTAGSFSRMRLPGM